jgi:hypothetical protein
MLETLADEEYTKIDKKCESMKKKVDFIVAIVRSNAHSLALAFSPVPDENKERFLYEKTAKAIESLRDYNVGRVCYSDDETLREKHRPFVSLGWVEIAGKENLKHYKLTGEGEGIYNAMQKIRGINSIQQSREELINGFKQTSRRY